MGVLVGEHEAGRIIVEKADESLDLRRRDEDDDMWKEWGEDGGREALSLLAHERRRSSGSKGGASVAKGGIEENS